ncbi:hypothetical protein BP00DRAFT_31968 [Aspergillus indologenus CBS 114.80]|uniref:Uncharacterized protein n=1 Tax=Aspergillus indologenus CBS 114.80 TaxID=1450541 RepID=A0A2V5HTS0_9EURO|nr:hypothetical protein BP00DRAFT_31968 [Aspergillus indologenus CBS 114.80]
MPLGKPIPTFPCLGDLQWIPVAIFTMAMIITLTHHQSHLRATHAQLQSRIAQINSAYPVVSATSCLKRENPTTSHSTHCSCSYFHLRSDAIETNIAHQASKRHTHSVKNYGVNLKVASQLPPKQSGSLRASIWLPPLPRQRGA